MLVVLKFHIHTSKIMWNMLYEARYEQSYLVSHYVYQARMYMFRYQDLHYTSYTLCMLYNSSNFLAKNAIQIYFRGHFT